MPLTSPLNEQAFQALLRRHITVPFAVGALSVGVFLGLITYLLSALGWAEHSQQVIGRANELTTLSVDLETGTRGFLLTGEDRFLEPYVLGRPKLAAGMEALAAEVRDNPVQGERIKQLQALQRQWDTYAQTLIEQRRRGQSVEAMLRADTGKLMFDGMRRQWAAFIDTEENLRDERSDAARRMTWSVTVGFSVVLLLLSAAVAWTGRRQTLQLSATYGTALRRYQESSEHLQRQVTLRGLQGDLAEQLAGELRQDEIGKRTLAALARSTGALLGALHVTSRGKPETVAVHGVRLTESDGQISADAGMVVQVAADGRPRELNALGSGHFRIHTGFGSSPPDRVHLAPLTREGRVNGVLELAFNEAPPAYTAELLTMIAETVGHALAGAQYREDLQRSLEESQQLNEELEVQQEELRSSNEALEVQSGQLRKSQSELERQQAELERQQAELELTNQRLAMQAAALDDQNEALREAQVQLKTRAEALQQASRYKSEFLANMSHELRTPLNSILILAKLLGENRLGNLHEDQVRFAWTVHSAGSDLLALINDILDLSKVEAGQLQLKPGPVGLADVMGSLRDIFRPQAEQKKLEFLVQVDADVSPVLVTDRLRLEQILKNLLSNALKFTESGQIALRVNKADERQVAISVEDTGIGIAPEHQTLVFEAFQQADAGIARRFGGTGLGLAISRKLAGLLGGTLTLSSIPGQGSRFVVTLPLELHLPTAQNTSEALPSEPTDAALDLDVRQAAPRVPAAPQSALPPGHLVPVTEIQPAFADDRDQTDRQRTVLVVEDDIQFAQMLYRLAHDAGFRAIVAHTAAAGLALALGQQPDAVLLDMHLPDVSGLVVLQRLKDDPQTRHIPVHVVAGEDLSRVALPLGAVDYAVKPVSLEELQAVFQRIGDKLDHPHKRVLVVEDDERQRDSVVQLIQGEGIEIDAVGTGEEALALLRQRVYDCMVVDLSLSDMTGEQLLEKMTGDNLSSFPPVIVYTGRVLTREEEAGLARYSRSIIIKGARSPERLLDEVTLFLHQVESQLSEAQQRLLRAARGRDQALEGRRLLLVDDDVRNIFALSGALEQRGMHVVIARHGQEALAKLDADPNIEIVLMDVMMPVMDGLEATRRLRADERFRKLPVIALTAKAMLDDREQCLQAGMSDYLSKPVDLDRLISLIRVWLPSSFRS